MMLLRFGRITALRSTQLRKTQCLQFSDDKKVPDVEKENTKTAKSPDKEKDESAAGRLNRLLASMSTDDNLTFAKKVEIPKPGVKAKAKKEKMKEEKENKQKAENIVQAAKDVADVLDTSADKHQKKKIESELLSKLLNHIDSEAIAAGGAGKPSTDVNLNNIIVGMKIDRRAEKKDDSQMKSLSRSQMVRRAISGKQYESNAEGRQKPPRRRLTEPVPNSGSVNLFGEQPLGIFKDPASLKDSSDMLKTWSMLEERELKLAISHPPRNYFEKMILWTEQGKVWKFPIDNEQGMEAEKNVDFSEHIFLDQHLENWCPARGPIRHFMELVCVGLSKNPYITAQDKREHLDWFKEYFGQKKDLLRDLIQEKEETAASKQIQKTNSSSVSYREKTLLATPTEMSLRAEYHTKPGRFNNSSQELEFKSNLSEKNRQIVFIGHSATWLPSEATVPKVEDLTAESNKRIVFVGHSATWIPTSPSKQLSSSFSTSAKRSIPTNQKEQQKKENSFEQGKQSLPEKPKVLVSEELGKKAIPISPLGPETTVRASKKAAKIVESVALVDKTTKDLKIVTKGGEQLQRREEPPSIENKEQNELLNAIKNFQISEQASEDLIVTVPRYNLNKFITTVDPKLYAPEIESMLGQIENLIEKEQLDAKEAKPSKTVKNEKPVSNSNETKDTKKTLSKAKLLNSKDKPTAEPKLKSTKESPQFTAEIAQQNKTRDTKKTKSTADNAPKFGRTSDSQEAALKEKPLTSGSTDADLSPEIRDKVLQIREYASKMSRQSSDLLPSTQSTVRSSENKNVEKDLKAVSIKSPTVNQKEPSVEKELVFIGNFCYWKPKSVIQSNTLKETAEIPSFSKKEANTAKLFPLKTVAADTSSASSNEMTIGDDVLSRIVVRDNRKYTTGYAWDPVVPKSALPFQNKPAINAPQTAHIKSLQQTPPTTTNPKKDNIVESFAVPVKHIKENIQLKENQSNKSAKPKVEPASSKKSEESGFKPKPKTMFQAAQLERNTEKYSTITNPTSSKITEASDKPAFKPIKVVMDPIKVRGNTIPSQGLNVKKNIENLAKTEQKSQVEGVASIKSKAETAKGEADKIFQTTKEESLKSLESAKQYIKETSPTLHTKTTPKLAEKIDEILKMDKQKKEQPQTETQKPILPKIETLKTNKTEPELKTKQPNRSADKASVGEIPFSPSNSTAAAKVGTVASDKKMPATNIAQTKTAKPEAAKLAQDKHLRSKKDEATTTASKIIPASTTAALDGMPAKVQSPAKTLKSKPVEVPEGQTIEKVSQSHPKGAQSIPKSAKLDDKTGMEPKVIVSASKETKSIKSEPEKVAIKPDSDQIRANSKIAYHKIERPIQAETKSPISTASPNAAKNPVATSPTAATSAMSSKSIEKKPNTSTKSNAKPSIEQSSEIKPEKMETIISSKLLDKPQIADNKTITTGFVLVDESSKPSKTEITKNSAQTKKNTEATSSASFVLVEPEPSKANDIPKSKAVESGESTTPENDTINLGPPKPNGSPTSKAASFVLVNSVNQTFSTAEPLQADPGKTTKPEAKEASQKVELQKTEAQGKKVATSFDVKKEASKDKQQADVSKPKISVETKISKSSESKSMVAPAPSKVKPTATKPNTPIDAKLPKQSETIKAVQSESKPTEAKAKNEIKPAATAASVKIELKMSEVKPKIETGQSKVETKTKDEIKLAVTAAAAKIESKRSEVKPKFETAPSKVATKAQTDVIDKPKFAETVKSKSNEAIVAKPNVAKSNEAKWNPVISKAKIETDFETLGMSSGSVKPQDILEDKISKVIHPPASASKISIEPKKPNSAAPAKASPNLKQAADISQPATHSIVNKKLEETARLNGILQADTGGKLKPKTNPIFSYPEMTEKLKSQTDQAKLVVQKNLKNLFAAEEKISKPVVKSVEPTVADTVAKVAESVVRQKDQPQTSPVAKSIQPTVAGTVAKRNQPQRTTAELSKPEVVKPELSKPELQLLESLSPLQRMYKKIDQKLASIQNEIDLKDSKPDLTADAKSSVADPNSLKELRESFKTTAEKKPVERAENVKTAKPEDVDAIRKTYTPFSFQIGSPKEMRRADKIDMKLDQDKRKESPFINLNFLKKYMAEKSSEGAVPKKKSESIFKQVSNMIKEELFTYQEAPKETGKKSLKLAEESCASQPPFYSTQPTVKPGEIYDKVKQMLKEESISTKAASDSERIVTKAVTPGASAKLQVIVNESLTKSKEQKPDAMQNERSADSVETYRNLKTVDPKKTEEQTSYAETSGVVESAIRMESPLGQMSEVSKNLDQTANSAEHSIQSPNFLSPNLTNKKVLQNDGAGMDKMKNLKVEPTQLEFKDVAQNETLQSMSPTSSRIPSADAAVAQAQTTSKVLQNSTPKSSKDHEEELYKLLGISKENKSEEQKKANASPIKPSESLMDRLRNHFEKQRTQELSVAADKNIDMHSSTAQKNDIIKNMETKLEDIEPFKASSTVTINQTPDTPVKSVASPEAVPSPDAETEKQTTTEKLKNFFRSESNNSSPYYTPKSISLLDHLTNMDTELLKIDHNMKLLAASRSASTPNNESSNLNSPRVHSPLLEAIEKDDVLMSPNPERVAVLSKEKLRERKKEKGLPLKSESVDVVDKNASTTSKVKKSKESAETKKTDEVKEEEEEEEEEVKKVLGRKGRKKTNRVQFKDESISIKETQKLEASATPDGGDDAAKEPFTQDSVKPLDESRSEPINIIDSPHPSILDEENEKVVGKTNNAKPTKPDESHPTSNIPASSIGNTGTQVPKEATATIAPQIENIANPLTSIVAPTLNNANIAAESQKQPFKTVPADFVQNQKFIKPSRPLIKELKNVVKSSRNISSSVLEDFKLEMDRYNSAEATPEDKNKIVLKIKYLTKVEPLPANASATSTAEASSASATTPNDKEDPSKPKKK